MHTSYEDALQRARALALPDRIQLIQQMWDEVVDSGETFTLPNELREELDRRLERHRTHPEEASPWPEVRARIEAKR